MRHLLRTREKTKLGGWTNLSFLNKALPSLNSRPFHNLGHGSPSLFVWLTPTHFFFFFFRTLYLSRNLSIKSIKYTPTVTLYRFISSRVFVSFAGNFLSEAEACMFGQLSPAHSKWLKCFVKRILKQRDGNTEDVHKLLYLITNINKIGKFHTYQLRTIPWEEKVIKQKPKPQLASRLSGKS